MKYILPIALTVFIFSESFAQTRECNKSTIENARQAYSIGNFPAAIDSLSSCITSNRFDNNQLVDAYKVIALAYIADEEVENAIAATSNLLKVDPSYTPSTVDPVEFKKLVTDVKVGLANKFISSVSKSNEDPLEAPATITLLTEEQIQRRGYRSIDELLQDVSGFDLAKGKGITRANIYQRGYRSNLTDRTLFLIDGVEENDLSFENAYLSTQYSISNIKRVEIIYGPASTMYGANAFAGVINIITKESGSNLSSDRSLGITADAGYGTWNTKYFDMTASGRKGAAALSVTARLYHSDEMDLSDYPEWDYQLGDRNHYINQLTYLDENGATITPTEDEIEQAIQYDQNAMDTILTGNTIGYTNHTENWSISSKLKVGDFTMGFNTWRREEGSVGWFNDRRAGSENGSVWIPKFMSAYLKYETYLSSKLSVTLFTRYKNHQIDDETKSVTLSSYDNGGLGLANLRNNVASSWSTRYFYSNSKQFRTEARGVYTTRNLTFISGLEYRNSIIQGGYITSTREFPSETGTPPDLLGGNNFEKNDIGIYTQGTYQFLPDNESKSLKLVGGVRMDHNRIRQNGGYGTVYNARAALVYKPIQDLVIKGLYASAFKDASSGTRYATTNDRLLPNPGLNPETVDNIELSIFKRFDFEKLGSLSFDIVGYRSSYSNVVGEEDVVITEEDIERYNLEGVNAGDATKQNRTIGSQLIQGVQANISYTYNNLDIYANYTHTNPKNTNPDESIDAESIRIGDIAVHRFNFGGNYLYNQWLNINLRVNVVGNQPSGEGTTVATNPNTQFGNYAILNGSIQYRSKYLNGLIAQLSVNNILDKEYFHPGVRTADNITRASRFPQDRRNFMFRLIYQL